MHIHICVCVCVCACVCVCVQRERKIEIIFEYNFLAELYPLSYNTYNEVYNKNTESGSSRHGAVINESESN